AQDDGTFTLIEEITGDVGVYRYNITDWSCFLENTVLASCSEDFKKFDCNDDDASINPGAIEDCDDGIDNDCDGLFDLEDDCVFDPAPPAEGCDFNGICEPDNENVYTCSDCIGYFPCPHPETGVNQIGKVGHYNLSMRWDEDGVPQLIIDPDGLQPNQNEYDCQWGYTDTNYPSGGVAEDKKEFAYTPSLLNNPKTQVAFRDSNGDYASVSVRSYFDPVGFTGWKLYYFGNGDQSAMRCWGLSDPNFRGNIGEDMSIFEFGHCSEQRCYSQDDCTAGSICTRLSDDYNFKVCMKDDFFGGCLDCCFTPETPVLTPKGLVSIEELRVGDAVIGFDQSTGKNILTTVVEEFVHKNNASMLLINERIHVTTEHMMYINGAWKRAEELVVGDLFLQDTGKEELITSIGHAYYDGLVYNIHTEPMNNYYAAGVLVHNMKADDFEYYQLPQ
ncbi:hypothetical protein GOV10_04520, partial [Candidatus Woesearchaeota archaeon]|nr:hypothetical protein [Candidatus Woesearchaeota archaeon]